MTPNYAYSSGFSFSTRLPSPAPQAETNVYVHQHDIVPRVLGRCGLD
jgi:hypothetical protein